MSKTYDVVIIGGGLAGIYSAKALKNGGKSVAIIEKESLGGTALISGALPVKKILDSFKNTNSKKDDIRKTLINNWDMELEGLNKKILKDMESLGIDIYYGDGKFINPKSFNLNGNILEAENFIIATGTSPASSKDIKIDNEKVISHIQGLDIKRMPKKVAILGGNVEGIELAAVYSELGVKVVLVEMEEDILSGNDKDLILPIKNHLVSLGTKIITGVKVQAVEVKENTIVILENGEKIICDKAISTLFRKPNFPKGLEKTNIKTDNEKILVDENLQTHEKNIFAIGDINGILGMGHVAIDQGMAVANYILSDKKITRDYDVFPRAVFTIPEMAGVGFQEWELKANNIPYKLGKCGFEDTWRGWANGAQGFTKVILDEEDKLLGVWMVGENVSEFIGLLGMAIKEGKKAQDILSNLIIHPSLSESILEAIIQRKEKVQR